MTEDFNQLGTAEKYVAEKSAKTIAEAITSTRELLDALEKLEGIDYELMVQSEKKELLVTMIPHLEKLTEGARSQLLIPLIMEAVLSKGEKT